MSIDSIVLKENYQNEILEVVKKRDWRKVLYLSQKYGFDITNQFMWCYPTVACTEYLRKIWKGFNISNILSIGCGSGLMEFILKESIGKNLEIYYKFNCIKIKFNFNRNQSKRFRS
jgi:hypothetical protein